MNETKTKVCSPWLWPDKHIGKRESRQLRNEHNALVEAYLKLLGAKTRKQSSDLTERGACIVCSRPIHKGADSLWLHTDGRNYDHFATLHLSGGKS